MSNDIEKMAADLVREVCHFERLRTAVGLHLQALGYEITSNQCVRELTDWLKTETKKVNNQNKSKKLKEKELNKVVDEIWRVECEKQDQLLKKKEEGKAEKWKTGLGRNDLDIIRAIQKEAHSDMTYEEWIERYDELLKEKEHEQRKS